MTARPGSIAISIALLGPAACGGDEVTPPQALECDEVGNPLGVSPDPGGAPPEFEVECASGWGHGYANKAASETLALPAWGASWIFPHPGGGWLAAISPISDTWDPWLLDREVPLADVVWTNRDLSEVHWGYDNGEDTFYEWILVEAPTGPELWSAGRLFDSLSFEGLRRIDAMTGEWLEDRTVPKGTELGNAWDPANGAWLAHTDYVENGRISHLARMAEFGELEYVQELEESMTTSPNLLFYPTPDDGVLWVVAATVMGVAPDGSTRWTHELGNALAVDDEGGFLRADLVVDEQTPQQLSVVVERRNVEDGEVLWTRNYRRYEFVDEPIAGEFEDPDSTWLVDYVVALAPRPGGYFVFVQQAYPSKRCPAQPLVLAIDLDGNVEWGHRVDVCGRMGAVGVMQVDDSTVVVGETLDPSGVSTSYHLHPTHGSWLRVFE